MKFFFDACLSPFLVSGIRALDEERGPVIMDLRQLFDDDTPDPVWIGELAKERDWIIISGDDRIHRSPANRKAWIESGFTAFFFAPPFPNDKYWRQAESLVSWWPTICKYAERTPTGHGYLIQKNAKSLKTIFPISGGD